MDPSEELAELLIVAGHRARIAFEDVCTCDERIGCEVLLMKALGRLGPGAKRPDLAHALGWTPGRVTQVMNGLVAKELVHRRRLHWLTPAGIGEADRARTLLAVVGDQLTDGHGDNERDALLASLRQVAARSERLWRIRRSAS